MARSMAAAFYEAATGMEKKITLPCGNIGDLSLTRSFYICRSCGEYYEDPNPCFKKYEMWNKLKS